MKKIAFLFSLLFIGVCSIIANKSYRVELSAPQLANQSVYLANYFNGKVYVNDTILLDKKGNGVFSKNKELPQGIYLIYFSPSRFYDFLLEQNQNLSIKIDTIQSINGFDIKGAKQSQAFNDYIRFMSSQKKEQDGILKKIDEVKSDSLKRKELQATLDVLDAKVLGYQKETLKAYEDKTLGLLIKGALPFQFPDSLVAGDMKDEAFLLKRYAYAKKHYWDNIDFSDERFWRFNYLNPRMNQFLDKVLFQHPDSIIPEVVTLIEKSKGKDANAFQIMTTNMLNYAASSKIMGMDKLLVVLAEKYYFTDQVTWADSTLLANLRSEVRKNKYNLLGNQAHNLRLEDEQGKVTYLYEYQVPMTLLFFFEPSCGHCKETTPKLMNVYNKYKDKGFKVIAFYTQTDQKEWTEFMDKYQLKEWVNVWDPKRESYYWYFFDTSTTPGVYLLDKNKKIIAKKIDMPTVDMILEHELK